MKPISRRLDRLRFKPLRLRWFGLLGSAALLTSCGDSPEPPSGGADGGGPPMPRAIEEQPLEVALLAESAEVLPGQAFRVGLLLEPEEGFHTYWKHPGVVGVPTSIEWRLPDGWSAGGIEWPAPEVVMMGPYPAHGYKGPVFLPTVIQVPPDAAPGQVTLRGDAGWMCCADTCHPGFRSLEVTVTVLPEGAERVPAGEDVAARFAAALAARPQPPKGFEFSAERDAIGLTVIVRRSGEAGVDATPLADLEELRFYCDQGIIKSDEEQWLEPHEDGSMRLRLVASPFGPGDATRLSGVFESPNGWYLDEDGRPVRHIQVTMPLPAAPVL